MVTGDNVKTAKAIAVECGILNSFADATEPNIIEGKTFRGMSDAERDAVAERILVESNYYDILVSERFYGGILFGSNIYCKYCVTGNGTVLSQ